MLERHHYACFTVEDENGNHFIVQLEYRLEEIWQKATDDKTAQKELIRRQREFGPAYGCR